jgi:serine/threonine-protein kinase ATR
VAQGVVEGLASYKVGSSSDTQGGRVSWLSQCVLTLSLLISSIYAASINIPGSSRRIVSGVPALLKESYPIQETVVLLLGDLGRIANEKDLVDILEILIKQLGSKSSPLRSVAYTQLIDIAAHRNKQPYNLLLPHLDRLSVLLAEYLVTHPLVVGEAMQFIGYNRQAFFTLEASRKNVVPTLVLRRNRSALDALASILGQPLAKVIIDEAPVVLAKVFLNPLETTRALDFTVSILNEGMANHRNSSTTIEKFVSFAIVHLVVIIVVELGDQNPEVQQLATEALTSVLHAVSHQGDLGSFLKPHMLGILHHMSDHLMAPRTTADHKRKIIRSMGKLIELVGDSMASFSPQVRVSFAFITDLSDHCQSPEHARHCRSPLRNAADLARVHRFPQVCRRGPVHWPNDCSSRTELVLV